MKRYLLLLALCALFPSLSSVAQTSLHMQKPRSAPPYRYVAFTAECNGTPVKSFSPGTLRIEVADMQVNDYIIIPPDTSIALHQRICVMVDVSADLLPLLLDSVRTALHALIDTLQPGDEMEITWYGRGTGVEQAMTSDTALLHRAVNNMPSVAPVSLSAIGFFDQCVHALARDSTHALSVLVLNGSLDTTGWAGYQARYAFNDSAWIAVHTILLRESAFTGYFMLLSSQAGGRIVSTFGDGLPATLRSSYRHQRLNNPATFTTVRIPFQHYRCDLMFPTIRITLPGCGPFAQDVEYMSDWLDSADITNLRCYLSSMPTFGNCIIDVDLLVEQESMTPWYISTDYYTVSYDTTRLRLFAPPVAGSLLATKNGRMSSTLGVSGFRLACSINDTVRYSGSIAHCRFLVAATDTARIDSIMVQRMGYYGSCYVATISPGIIDVKPQSTALHAGFAWPPLTQTSGDETVLPLFVEATNSTALDAEIASLHVYFSTVSTACLGIDPTPGTLFADGKITYEPSRGGGLLRFAPGCRITKSGILCYLRFRPVNAQDTSLITVSIGEADFTSGCAWPVYSKGGIRFNQHSNAVSAPPLADDPIASLDLYPLPAKDRSTLRLELRRAAEVNISLVTLLGQELGRLFQGRLESGIHELAIDRTYQSTGPVFLRIDTGVKQLRVLPVLWKRSE